MDVSIPGVIVVAGVVLFGALVTGKGPELCTAMGGTYRNVAPPLDQCPDGKWSNLLKTKPAPTK